MGKGVIYLDSFSSMGGMGPEYYCLGLEFNPKAIFAGMGRGVQPGPVALFFFCGGGGLCKQWDEGGLRAS